MNPPTLLAIPPPILLAPLALLLTLEFQSLPSTYRPVAPSRHAHYVLPSREYEYDCVKHDTHVPTSRVTGQTGRGPGVDRVWTGRGRKTS